MLDVQTIEATAMQDYLPCKMVTLVCDVKTIAATAMHKMYRSNSNAELSPLQEYRKTKLY